MSSELPPASECKGGGMVARAVARGKQRSVPVQTYSAAQAAELLGWDDLPPGGSFALTPSGEQGTARARRQRGSGAAVAPLHPMHALHGIRAEVAVRGGRHLTRSGSATPARHL